MGHITEMDVEINRRAMAFSRLLNHSKAKSSQSVRTSFPWLPEEDAIVKKYAGVLTNRQIANMVGRTPGATSRRKMFLGVQDKIEIERWEWWQVKYLINNNRRRTMRQIGNVIGKSVSAVSKKKRSMGLSSVRKKWQEWEDLYLYENHNKMGTSLLAVKLGKSYSSVNCRLHFLDLK